MRKRAWGIVICSFVVVLVTWIILASLHNTSHLVHGVQEYQLHPELQRILKGEEPAGENTIVLDGEKFILLIGEKNVAYRGKPAILYNKEKKYYIRITIQSIAEQLETIAE